MTKCRVILADDHVILTQAASSLLSNYNFIDLVGVSSDGEQLMKMINELHPDILIADISMPGRSIFDISEEINEKALSTKVIIFTMHDEPEYVYKALKSHIYGYLTKNAEKDELVEAIENVREGQEYYSLPIRQIIARGFKHKSQAGGEQSPLTTLSKREEEVLQLLVEGLSSKQIGERLFISERTVANHRANMLHKCKVSNTIELIRLYLDHVHTW